MSHLPLPSKEEIPASSTSRRGRNCDGSTHIHKGRQLSVGLPMEKGSRSLSAGKGFAFGTWMGVCNCAGSKVMRTQLLGRRAETRWQELARIAGSNYMTVKMGNDFALGKSPPAISSETF